MTGNNRFRRRALFDYFIYIYIYWGERVCNLKIQKSSLCSNKLWIFNFDNDFLQTCSMIVNLAWTLKLCPGIWQCSLQGGPSVLQTSFLCVLSLSCIRIFERIVIFRKGNIPSDKLRSCFYKWRYVWLKICICERHFERLSKFWVVYNID